MKATDLLQAFQLQQNSESNLNAILAKNDANYQNELNNQLLSRKQDRQQAIANNINNIVTSIKENEQKTRDKAVNLDIDKFNYAKEQSENNKDYTSQINAANLKALKLSNEANEQNLISNKIRVASDINKAIEAYNQSEFSDDRPALVNFLKNYYDAGYNIGPQGELIIGVKNPIFKTPTSPNNKSSIYNTLANNPSFFLKK